MKYSKKILSLLLVFLMLAALFVGCTTRDEDPNDEVSQEEVSEAEGDDEPEDLTVGDSIVSYTGKILEKQAENPDSIGWLRVPNTGIDSVVVVNYEDNEYYRKTDFDGKQTTIYGYYVGSLYADRRSTFGDGTRDGLGINTTIYGHSFTDNSEYEDYYKIMFANLHDFRDPELAKDIPYIYFSSENENMAFEVFAVFVANSDNPALPYNRNDVEPADFYKMIQEEVLPRSLYNYDVDVKEGDKVLTLSTCIYTLPNGVSTNYPDTYMRYAIMAKLVDDDEPLKTEASFEINQDAIIDDDGPIGSAA